MKVAILIDGAFLQKKFFKIHHKNISVQDIINIIKKTMDDNEFANDILFRTYYYDCYPYGEKLKHPITKVETDFSKTPLFAARTNFLRDLSLQPRVALRSGSLSFSGWEIPGKYVKELRQGVQFTADMLKAEFKQKEVDIKIGLDIAWIASRKIVDKMVIYTGDSDIVPAMKLARKEGLMIFLSHLGHFVKHALKEHCDGIIPVTL